MRPQLRSEESRTPKFFKRFKDPRDAGVRIDEDAVRSAYRRWAPVYDHTFGRGAAAGRRRPVAGASGVGRSLSRRRLGLHLELFGIDLSPEVLEKARERVAAEGLDNVAELHEMDARDQTFPAAPADTD